MDTTRHPRDYELMTILIPDMADEDTQAALDKVHGYITGVQGEISETLTDSPWGRRRLAYTIRHESVDYRDGFYSVIHFSALPTAISDIERELKLDTNVIRYLLVMNDPKAGEKNVAQPEDEAAAAEDTSASAPATTDEAPVAEEASAATEEAPVADETPAAAAEDAPAAEEATETAVQETAATIEGEEEPAPADGAEVATADTKES